MLASGKGAGFGGPQGKQGAALGTSTANDALTSLVNDMVKHETNITSR